MILFCSIIILKCLSFTEAMDGAAQCAVCRQPNEICLRANRQNLTNFSVRLVNEQYRDWSVIILFHIIYFHFFPFLS